MDLDRDPYEIESWEEYCKSCIKASRIDLFKKKLSTHIFETNRPILECLKAFALKIQGEIVQQELLRQHKLLKKRKL